MPPRRPPLNLWTRLALLSFGLGSAWLLTRAAVPSERSITEVTRTEATRTQPTETEAADMPRTTPSRTYGHETHTVGGAIAHVVTQPPDTKLSIAVAEELATVDTFAKQANANCIINGGFFDPNNGKTTSYLISQGQTIGDPADNERLTGNPSLRQYMAQIFNRSELRVYRCHGSGASTLDTPIYDITFRNASPPDGCEVDIALGAGPQLLPVDTSETEGFTDYDDGTLIRDAIGSLQPNARSAVGLYPEGAIALIMIEKNEASTGLTLPELASFATSLGITKLLNLDGGSSSSLFIATDQTYFGQSDAEGDPIRRPVKSVILLGN